jgi:hypothetical protein
MKAYAKNISFNHKSIEDGDASHFNIFGHTKGDIEEKLQAILILQESRSAKSGNQQSGDRELAPKQSGYGLRVRLLTADG